MIVLYFSYQSESAKKIINHLPCVKTLGQLTWEEERQKRDECITNKTDNTGEIRDGHVKIMMNTLQCRIKDE